MSGLKHATLTRVHLWKTELPGARDGRGLNECQLFSITKLKKIFHINGLFRAANPVIFFPPQVTYFLVLWKMLHLDWLFMSVQSLVSGVREKSEHFTLFFKIQEAACICFGAFWVHWVQVLEREVTNYCSFIRIQIFFTLIPYLYLFIESLCCEFLVFLIPAVQME